jgi:N-acylneuraminate cytidylyltransferase
LCVIPARGGSKGIPRKNLRSIGGKPLIAWTVEQALAIADHHPVDVVVSTDDEEIADAARAAGAEVPFLRPAHLAEDITPTEPVVLHAIDELTAAGREPDVVMLLQATSPLRHADTLTRALAEFRATEVDALVGVVHESPFLWRDGDPPRAEYPVDARPRRQDLTPEQRRYRETGSVYVTRTEIYRSHGNRLGGRIGLFVMDDVEGVDIDTELDLDLAERRLPLLR